MAGQRATSPGGERSDDQVAHDDDQPLGQVPNGCDAGAELNDTRESYLSMTTDDQDPQSYG